MSTDYSQIPLACDLNAIPAGERAAHTANTQALFAAVTETQELADGYAFRLPAGTAVLQQAAAFIANERLCCRFFRFELEVEPGGGPVWLRLRGQEGVKAFIAAEFGVSPAGH